MAPPNSISIESLPRLLGILRASSLHVVWCVRCEIGPDWIGGGREIQLLLKGQKVSGKYCDELISAIITAAAIPGQANDSVISGEGEVSLQDNNVMLEFEWNEAVPYDAPRDSGRGRVALSLS